MIAIFAKHKTNEKIVIGCIRKQVTGIQKQLNEQFGGQWIFVDHLESGEILKYSDKKEYKGFSPDIERYFDLEKLENIECLFTNQPLRFG